jgi:tetratricopeptide (TPR) repeat protein
MKAFPTSRRLRVAPDTAALCATVVIAPHLFGGAFPWTVVVITGLSLASLGIALWVRRVPTNPVVDGVFLFMSVAWIWTCLQAIPLSPGIADVLDLRSLETAKRLQGLAWADRIPLTISYDPGSTQLQILVGTGILAAFVAARLGGPAGLKPIAIATVVSALLMGLIGFAHEAVGSKVLFGIYSPRFTADRLLAPLMNGNHLAGFSLLGAVVAVGLAAQERRRSLRFAWIGASVFCAMVVAWTLSRGGIGALLSGFLVVGIWLVGRGKARRPRAVIPAAVVGATVTGVIAFAGLEPILRRFETQGLDKLQLAGRGLRLLDGSVWWLGVGRGAFSTAFVAHEGSLARATHPENLLVQWTTEWGVPVALALLLVLIVAGWKRFRTAEEPIVAAVCIAIFALFLQNLVDFGLEMAGVVVVVTALLGALLPAVGTMATERARHLSLAFFAAGCIALVGLGPRVLESDTQSMVDRLAFQMQADDGEGFEATLRRGLTLHPSEPALALFAGTYAGSLRHPDTVRWLSVVMEEAPGWAAPHVVAAQLLIAEGMIDQALLEIREAEQRDPGRGQQVLCELLGRFPLMEHVKRAAPSEDRRHLYLKYTAQCPGLPAELRAELDGMILQKEPTHPWAVLREAQRLTAGGRSNEAIAMLEQSLAHHEGNDGLRVAVIMTHLKAGDPERAQLALQRALSDRPETRELLEAQARIEAALGEADAMRSTITRLRGRASGDVTAIARSFMLQAELEASLGNVDEALAAYAAADEASPTAIALHQAAALALRSNRRTQALRIYRTLCRRFPGGSACDQEARLAKSSFEDLR